MQTGIAEAHYPAVSQRNTYMLWLECWISCVFKSSFCSRGIQMPRNLSPDGNGSDRVDSQGLQVFSQSNSHSSPPPIISLHAWLYCLYFCTGLKSSMIPCILLEMKTQDQFQHPQKVTENQKTVPTSRDPQ